MDKNSLLIDSISKTYKKKRIRANDNITMKLNPSEVTALIGHNGAGKTTLLNQIIGNIKPDSGSITYNGISLIENTKIARELVSMMPQFHAPLEGVTLKQSIESIVRIRGASEREVRLYTKQILRDLDIEKWANQTGNKLSGGLRRLTSFAMAVAYPSDIILLDEPTNDVDPIRRKLVWQYMRKLAKEGHLIFVVTHNLLEVEQYADRYILLNKGRVIRDVSTKNIRNNFDVNMMIVTLCDFEELQDLPISENCEFKKDELLLVFTLSERQVLGAVDWLMKLIRRGKVLNYKLTSATLDIQYGGMIDEKQSNTTEIENILFKET